MKAIRKRTGFAIVAALAVPLVSSLGGEAVAQGCAMCKTAVGGPGDPLARGINTSIMFMMAMPFLLFTVVGGWLAYAFRTQPASTMDEPAGRVSGELVGTE